MRDADAERFATALYGAMEVVGGRVTDRAMTFWWEALRAYRIEDVEAALHEHAAQSVYAPKPADVIARIGEADGRPGAEEAWAIALASADESATVVWTDEIAAARAAARPILDQGDKVGARFAFRELYEAEVRQARNEQRPVNWQVSLGHDPEQRAPAIRAAYEQGRISADQAAAYLPVGEGNEVVGRLEGGGRITPQQQHENLRQLRKQIAEAFKQPCTAEDEAGQHDRTRAWARSRLADSEQEGESDVG